MDFCLFLKKNVVGSRKIFPEHRRARTTSGTPSAFFIIHIDFVLKVKNTYTVPTLVLTRVCRPWVMYHVDTLTTLPELISLKQRRWSK